MRFRLVVDGETHEVVVEGEPPSLTVRVDGAVYRARAARQGDEIGVRIGPARHRIRVLGRQVLLDGVVHEVQAENLEPVDNGVAGQESARSGARIEVRPPMPGRIVKVAVAPGDRVKRGQTLAVLEAMKMQNEIPAPTEAVVRSVGVQEGESILSDRIIAVLEVP